MSSEPTRHEKLVMGLRVTFALTEDEAENMLRQYRVDVVRAMQVDINELPEPKVWAAPLKWWRKGRDAALSVLCEDILSAIQAAREYDEKGHKIHGEPVRGPHECHRPSARAEDRGGAADRG